MKNHQIRNRVAVIIVEEDKILLVQHEKHGQTYWLLPGGGVEFGETLEEAAKREMMEEANLTVEMGDLLFLSESIPPDQHRHVINYYFPATITGGHLQVGADDVLRDVQWHWIEDLPHLVVYPNTVNEILAWHRTQKAERLSLGNRWE
ncbi:MAG: NUDIX domain-containing protein [bacterium]|jgi:ADP-ribose pyrophosphatase YjhB (NUDIX family)|nr:NUDIX domain-containing protein [bacterium]